MSAVAKTYQEIVAELSRTRVFSHLQQDKLEYIATMARSQSFSKGSTILAEGSPNHDLFFLLKGTVTVYSGGKMVSRYSRAGDIFGEMSVVSDEPASATVIANDEVETIVVDGRYVGGFRSQLDHEMVTVFYKIFSLSLLEKLKLTTLKARLFEDAIRHLHPGLQEPPGGFPEKTVEKNLNDTLLTSLAVHSADQAIVVTDAKGQVVRFNLAAESMFSCIELQVVGKPIKTLCEEKSYGIIFPRVIAGEISSWSGELDFVTALGKVFPARTQISVVKDHDGAGIGLLTIVNDISKEKNLERELRQAQKMEAVGQLAGGVAHDFNNLLQIISGYTRMAINRFSEESQEYKELNFVLEAAERGSYLTHRLLATSRRKSSLRTSIDPNLAVSTLAGMLMRVIEEHIEIHFEAKKDLWRIHADAALVEQVLMNLCLNARDAMPGGGTLTLATGNVEFDKKFCAKHQWARKGEFVAISVQDTGMGIPTRHLEQIFEPFFTTKEEGKGTGLGLAMAREIVEGQGGFVRVESAVNRGTTISVFLPRQLVPTLSLIEKPSPKTLGGTETILVAEDEYSVQYFISQILEGAGYRVLTASNGEEVLKVYEREEGGIDLLLLDAIMPKMNGMDVFKKLKEQKPELRVLFTSGYTPSMIGLDFLETNNLRVVAKPFNPELLLGEIRQALDHTAAKAT